ncbi:MAG: SRPBCC family protein [Actinomycetota bacterium]
MREVVHERIVVNRPLSSAWKHLAHLEDWPSWAGHIRRMEPTPRGDLTASTQVLMHMRAGPRNKMIVTEYDPPAPLGLGRKVLWSNHLLRAQVRGNR